MTPNPTDKPKIDKYPSEKESKKDRPGSDSDQPANEDYDYRPDFGESGGGAEHNPEVEDSTEATKPSTPKVVPGK